MGVRSGSGSRKRRHLRIECAHKRPSHIDGKRLLNIVVSVIATNREWGEAADGISTRVGTCLINRLRVRINREGLYNVKAYAPKKGAENQGTQKREKKNKNMKLHGQDPRTTLARLCVSTMSTMINYRPVTKV